MYQCGWRYQGPPKPCLMVTVDALGGWSLRRRRPRAWSVEQPSIPARGLLPTFSPDIPPASEDLQGRARGQAGCSGTLLVSMVQARIMT